MRDAASLKKDFRHRARYAKKELVQRRMGGGAMERRPARPCQWILGQTSHKEMR